METPSDELLDLGYEPTGRESPFEEGAELWTKGFELVCDKTGIVIRKRKTTKIDIQEEEKVYRYQNSDKVKQPGGHVSSYDWRENDELFEY